MRSNWSGPMWAGMRFRCRGLGRAGARGGRGAGADAAAGRQTFPAVVGLEASKTMAKDHVTRAIEAVKLLEPEPGPLAALARYTIDRAN